MILMLDLAVYMLETQASTKWSPWHGAHVASHVAAICGCSSNCAVGEKYLDLRVCVAKLWVSLDNVCTTVISTGKLKPDRF